jgi:hypothetical protein
VQEGWHIFLSGGHDVVEDEIAHVIIEVVTFDRANGEDESFFV